MGKYLTKKVKGFTKNINIAVESGTFLGESTRQMSEGFNKVITIELDQKLYKETRKKLEDEGYKNIEFLNGDSGVIIEKLSKEIDEPALFFLDAHWSGDSTIDWDKSNWKGYGVDTAHLGSNEGKPTNYEQVPLDREIKAISTLYKSRGVIYIDDIDKFSSKGSGLRNRAFIGEDYSHLNLKNFRKDFGTRLISWRNIKFKQLIIVFDKIPTNSKEEIFQKVYFCIFFRLKFFLDNLRNLKYFLRGKFSL